MTWPWSLHSDADSIRSFVRLGACARSAWGVHRRIFPAYSWLADNHLTDMWVCSATSVWQLQVAKRKIGLMKNISRIIQGEILMQVQGVGSSATITQPDLRTCGASIVHIVDSVLLPFNPVTGPVPDG